MRLVIKGNYILEYYGRSLSCNAMKFTCLKGHANFGTGTKETTSGRIHKRKAPQRCLMVEYASLTEVTPNLSVHQTQVYNSLIKRFWDWLFKWYKPEIEGINAHMKRVIK